jgi:hypothetical protein
MKIGILYYGSLYDDYFHKNLNIIQGPQIKVRLSSFNNNNNKINLTRNLSHYGEYIQSSIMITEINNINQFILSLSKREFYCNNNDFEPICYIKKKDNNNFSLKMPIYDNNYRYYGMVYKLYEELKKYCIKYNLNYIFFISYIDRIQIFNIDNTLSTSEYNKALIKLINKDKNLAKNTKIYLLKCDPNTYTSIDKYIIKLKN